MVASRSADGVLFETRSRTAPVGAYTILKDADSDQAELVEIDENPVCAELTPAEQAKHVTRRKVIYERLYPETKHGAVGRRGKVCDAWHFRSPASNGLNINSVAC